MNILHISHIPDHTNGIFSVLMALVVEQRKLGHQVTAYNFCAGDACNEVIAHNNTIGLKNCFKTESPDIVIFHGVFYYEIYTLAKCLRKMGIPYLIELHGSLSVANMKKSRIKKLFARKMFLDDVIRNAAAVIYLNEDEKNNSAVLNVNPNAVVIPNGCYIPEQKREDVKNDVTEILFLGRIDINHKGLDMLLPALKKLKSEGRTEKLHVSFYGSGEQKDVEWLNNELTELAGVADYYGPVYGDQKEETFRNADMLILTSRYEGFPMVILESLSVGTPCLVTPATNVTDIIKKFDAGWVANSTVNSISETILKATADLSKRKDKIRENALDLSLQYQWHNVAELSVEKYREFV